MRKIITIIFMLWGIPAHAYVNPVTCSNDGAHAEVYLSTNVWQCVSITGGGGGAVSSVFGRTGAVVSANGDYTVSQITGAAPLASPTFTGAVAINGNLGVGSGSPFAVNGTTGNVTAGVVTASGFSGPLTGNASTATALQTVRTINGTNFDGTANITVTAAAGTLTGTVLNSSVVTSSLTTVGTIGTGVWNGTRLTSSFVPTDVAYLDVNQTFSSSQRATLQALTISTSTFTPNFDTGADFSITLVHASCPCTLANPSTTPVAGQHGIIYIKQSSTGSDLISTYGTDYESSGGTSTISLSTSANATDVFSYTVQDSTHIILSPPVVNVSH